eukprot:425739-Amorphochlora_amoeboformis.AAC.1
MCIYYPMIHSYTERWGFRIYRIFTGNPSPPFLIAIRKYPPGAQNAHRMSFQFQLNDVNAGDETSSLTGDLGLSSLLLAILSSEDMLSMRGDGRVLGERRVFSFIA